MTPTAVVREYLARVQAHDVEGAMALLGDDFVLVFEGTDFRMDRDGARNALEWDRGVNGRLSWSIVDHDDTSVSVAGTETNDFLQLIDFPDIGFHSRYHVDPARRIVRQDHRAEWPARTLDDALAPAIAWAREHETDELDAIYADGTLTYNGETAVRWVALLGRWRAATKE